MADKLFEIAFSGQIADGADLESVKQKIGNIFNADETRLAQMFSGRRVLIKRQADEVTMIKYRGAFQKAGAICEVVDLAEKAADENEKTDEKPQNNAYTSIPTSGTDDYVSKYPESDDVPQALLSDPLGIHADSIQVLETDIAPVGSPMLDQVDEISEPQIDISGMDVAPVGSDLATKQGEEPPPPPDTRGLTMAD